MKKYLSPILVALVTVFACINLAACSTTTPGEAETITETIYETTHETTVVHESIDIGTLYSEYLEHYPNSTFEEFLQSLDITYTDTEFAASQAIDSAVSIYTEYTTRTYDKFGRPIGTGSAAAAGSGVIYQIDGDNVYIITNYHVLYDSANIDDDKIADDITIYTYNYEDEEFKINAEFIGGDITKDIAMLVADVDDFEDETIKVATVAENSPKLGSTAVVIGNPLAEGISVTSGVISVISEEIIMESLSNPNTTVTMTVMRTDAAINSGNSGGGLFNAEGKLIGIVNAKAIEDGVENMGFAIHASTATYIADKWIETYTA